MSEPLKQKIFELIEQTSDPVQKAHLLIMLQMSDLLAENTAATMQVSEDVMGFRRSFTEHTTAFTQHAKDEEILIAQGQASWKTATKLLGLIQFIIVIACGMLWNDYKEMKSKVEELEQNKVRLEERHRKEDTAPARR